MRELFSTSTETSLGSRQRRAGNHSVDIYHANFSISSGYKDSPYKLPAAPDLVIDTSICPVDESVEKILNYLS